MSRFAALRSKLVFLAAIAIGLFTASVPASAQTYPGFVLTAPAQGAIVPAQSNVQIQWTGGDPNWTVGLTLYRGTPWGPVATPANNIPNSGSFSWSFPASLSCGEQYLFQITKTNAADWTQWNWGPAFTIACSGDAGDKTALKVIKTVTNNTGANLAGLHYPVAVTCGNALPSQLSLTEGGQPQALTNLPIGVTCNIAEGTPPPPPTDPKVCPPGTVATWLPATYSPGPTITLGASGTTATVHNTVTCVPVRQGSLTVIKKIVNIPGADISGITIPVQAVCGSYTSAFQLNAANGWQHTVSNVALGTSCYVIEAPTAALPLPANPGKCVKPNFLQWSQTPVFTPPSVVVNGAASAITITNTLNCLSQPPPVGKTDLKLVKTITVVAPAAPPASGTHFVVDVSCGSAPTVHRTFTYTGGQIPNQYVPGIPNGTTCSVVEQPLSSAPIANGKCPSGYAAWGQVRYPDPANPNGTVQSVVMGYSSDTLYVLNTLACEKARFGSVTISKLVTNNTHGSLPSSYPMTVSCNGQIITSPHVMAGTSIGVNNVPLNTSCQVDEDWQRLPLPASPRACPQGTVPEWQKPIFSPAQPFAVGPLPVHVVVKNEIDCVKAEAPSGQITIKKQVENHTSANLAGLRYPITVSCPGIPDTHLGLADGQSSVANNVAPSADCKVTEDTQHLPIPDAGKACPDGATAQWTTTVSPTGYVHAGDAVTVDNVLDCSKPKFGRLIINKEIHSSTPGLLAAVAGLHYPVTVSCAGQAPQPLSVVAGQSFPVNNLPLGISCNVVESAALPMPRNVCPPGTAPQWHRPLYVPGMPVSIGALTTVTVKNDIECEKVEPKFGALDLIKRVVNTTGANLAGKQYPVTIACGGSASTSVNLTAGGAPLVVPNLPIGGTCTVTEAALQPPPNTRGVCPEGSQPEWTPAVGYTPGQTVAINGQAPTTVTLLNTLQCVPSNTGGKSTLTIKKVVNDRTNGYAPAISFPVQVTCGSAQPLPLTVSANGTASTTVPAGINCSISEGPLPPPSIIPGACPAMAGWQTSPGYSPSHIVNIPSSGSAQVLITNTFGCLAPGIAPKPIPKPNLAKPLECKAPTMPNKAGTECVCEDGTVPTEKGCSVAQPDIKSIPLDKSQDKIPDPLLKGTDEPTKGK